MKKYPDSLKSKVFRAGAGTERVYDGPKPEESPEAGLEDVYNGPDPAADPQQELEDVYNGPDPAIEGVYAGPSMNLVYAPPEAMGVGMGMPKPDKTEEGEDEKKKKGFLKGLFGSK